ncbi:MAG: ATP synthase F1 subunit gamma [Bacteroidales bacterium]|jgi:F-type H+-transporting ATPase subunit gamma|nr:ATP synthase F1 subunit gamma [Bacteroidales bacterium]
MANLKEIRIRIASVVSTRQITSAMKMVAAAKLKKAQDTIVNFRPYARKMQEIMVNVASAAGNVDGNVYAEDRDCHNALVVVITSNRGLCGAFNSNAIKEGVRTAESKYGELLKEGKVHFYTIGKKGYDNLSKRNLPIDRQDFSIFDNLTYDNVALIAELLMDAFKSGKYDSIDIVYNGFVNAAVQQVTVQHFLPLLPEEEPEIKSKTKKVKTDYIYEPSKEFIIKELIPQNLKMLVYQALLDSVASEHGARMTSMHQATDNASQLITDLTLQYNKARQASITNELVEIVSGAEALNG